MAYNILLATESFDVQSVVTLHISSEYNIPVTVYKSVDESLKALASKQSNQTILLIDYALNGNRGGELYANLPKDRKYSCLLLTDEFPKNDTKLNGFFVSVPRNKYIKFPITKDELTLAISELLEIKKPSNKIGFRRIAVDEIGMLLKNNFTVYICDHESNYVALDIKKIGSLPEFIEDYKKTDEEYLYIKSEEFERFGHLLSSALTAKLKNPRTPIAENLSIQLNSVKNIHRTLRDLCLTDSEIELAQTCVDSTLKILNKKGKTSELIAKLMKNNNYQQEIAMMTSYLSSAIIMNTDWYSVHTMEKLSMASLLMDASLAHIDQTKVVTKKDVDALTPSDRQLVFNHPLKTVELINEIPEIPQDVKNIILAHHERPDGSGFPKSLDSTNLSPLSSAFILAHEFSHRLLAHPKTKESLMKTVTDFQQYYSTNNFKKPYQAFINVFRLKK